MDETRITINRTLVGLCAIVCLLVACGLWYVERSHSDQGDGSRWSDVGQLSALGASVRLGLLLGACWIALPRGSRQITVSLRTFVIIAGGFVCVAVLRVKYALPLVFVVLLLAVLLKPRDPNRKQKKLAEKYRETKPADTSQKGK